MKGNPPTPKLMRDMGFQAQAAQADFVAFRRRIHSLLDAAIGDGVVYDDGRSADQQDIDG